MFLPLRITPKGEPIAVLTIMYKTTHSLMYGYLRR